MTERLEKPTYGLTLKLISEPAEGTNVSATEAPRTAAVAVVAGSGFYFGTGAAIYKMYKRATL